jgi:hypothetical protein
MQTPWRAVRAMSILLASLVALSCNNGYGIFQTIQGEKKQVGTLVFQETSVSNVFGLGGSYYAATGTLNASLVGADSWSAVAIGSPPSKGYVLRSAVLTGSAGAGTIYALIEVGTEPNMTIQLFSSTDGANWTAIPLPAQTITGANAFTFDALFGTSTNGLIFAEGHAYNTNQSDPSNPGPSTYTLWYSLGGAAFQQVTNFAPGVNSNKTIRGVVCDTSGNYYFASENLLQKSPTYSDGGSDFSSTLAPGTFPNAGTAATTVWDISFTGGSIYVSRQDGVLFQYSFSGPASSNSLGSLPLTQVIQVPSAITTTTLLVGSDAIGTTAAVGYFEGTWGAFAIGSTNSEVASNSSIFSTTVAPFPVHAFYYDAVAGNLFIAVSPGFSSTSYYGLYKSIWTGTWSGWAAQ